MNIDTANAALFLLFKTLPKWFFRDAVQTCHDFLSICYAAKWCLLRSFLTFGTRKKPQGAKSGLCDRWESTTIFFGRYTLTNRVVRFFAMSLWRIQLLVISRRTLVSFCSTSVNLLLFPRCLPFETSIYTLRFVLLWPSRNHPLRHSATWTLALVTNFQHYKLDSIRLRCHRPISLTSRRGLYRIALLCRLMFCWPWRYLTTSKALIAPLEVATFSTQSGFTSTTFPDGCGYLRPQMHSKKNVLISFETDLVNKITLLSWRLLLAGFYLVFQVIAEITKIYSWCIKTAYILKFLIPKNNTFLKNLFLFLFFSLTGMNLVPYFTLF